MTRDPRSRALHATRFSRRTPLYIWCPAKGARAVKQRILELLTRLGHLVEEEGVTYVADGDLIDPDNLFTRRKRPPALPESPWGCGRSAKY
jgi:hypothetical protein